MDRQLTDAAAAPGAWRHTYQGFSMTRKNFVESEVGSGFNLKSLSPFESLSDELVAKIRRRARLREHGGGDVLLREGEPNDEVLYVVSGRVELRRDDRRIGVVDAGTSEARKPLSKSTTHLHSAEVLSRKAQVLAIDADRLDMLVTLEQTSSYRVMNLQSAWASEDDAEDWMIQVLRSRAFTRIPPVNIQAMFMRLQRVEYKKGDVVIRQGDEGDFFYLIAHGRCVVTRDMPTNAPALTLAELGVGACFGEDALVSNGRRCANVSMLTDGTLMRLDRNDFHKYCREPLIRELTPENARAVVRAGGRWLDVRLPGEAFTGIAGALRIPLHVLRTKLDSLPKSTPLVAICDTGRRSAVATFILAQQGFNVSMLKGGIFSTTAEIMQGEECNATYDRARAC